MKVLNASEKCTEKFVRISKLTLYVIAGVMLLWLGAKSLLNGNQWRTFSEGLGESSLRVLALLMALLCSLLVGTLLETLFSKYTKAESIVVTIIAAIFWGISIWWVSKVPYVIDGDQAVIWQNAVLNMQGDFSMFAKGGQMFIYPQQQGLSFLYELLFRITKSTSFRMIGYCNASLAPVTLIFGYDCTKMCFGKSVAVRFLPLLFLCLPYIIYAPYVYGDIPSIALTFVLLWAILKQAQSHKKRYCLLACVVAALALLCRMNVWIVLIGIGIGLSYHCLYKKSLKPLILAVAIVLSASLSMTALKAWNASRANEPVSKGMPSVLWMAMGLQYSEYGAGYYNDYSKRIFEQVGYDNALASSVARTEIKERMYVFLSDRYQARLFFNQKMEMQWLDGLFESTKFTGTFGDLEPSDLSAFVASIYHGELQQAIKRFSECMLCIVYVFACVGIIVKFIKEVKNKQGEKEASLLKEIPLIIFVGGFLFSIMWEAKARYMLPYYVLLHMYAAFGLTQVTIEIKTILNKYLCKKETTEV